MKLAERWWQTYRTWRSPQPEPSLPTDPHELLKLREQEIEELQEKASKWKVLAIILALLLYGSHSSFGKLKEKIYSLKDDNLIESLELQEYGDDPYRDPGYGP